MYLSIATLEDHALEFREEFAPEVFDFGPDVRQRGPLRAQGRAQLLEERQGHKKSVQDIQVSGELSTTLELLCARCLEPVVRDVSRPFDLLYRPLGTDAGHEELSVTQAEADIGYYTGDGLLLEDALREQVLLTVPIKTVCHEQCKGLCPQCGQNLNQGACACATPPAEPRWAALEELKNKLK